MLKMLGAAASLVACTGPSVAAASVQASSDVRQADVQVEQFLTTLRSGNGVAAVQALMSSSPLWGQRAGSSEQMAGQIDAAVKAYGPIIAHEKISATPLGTMALREYYLVQHRDMVTRWEFDLIRTSKGWSVGYFGFSDQPNTWF